MTKNYSKEVKELIKKYDKNQIVFGKDWDFLHHRIKVSKEVLNDEIMKCENLSFTKKQTGFV